MKNNALIIHGCCDKKEYFDKKYPSPSNFHWLSWLQKELLTHNIPTQTPEMPRPYEANYSEWEKVFEQFAVGEETILIGHSCGGGFLLRWLSENKKKIKKLVLVAPYLDPNKRRGDFLKFNIYSELNTLTKEIHVLISDDEEESIKISVEKIMAKITTAKLHKFIGMGHFTLSQMGTEKFPELLDIILD